MDQILYCTKTQRVFIRHDHPFLTVCREEPHIYHFHDKRCIHDGHGYKWYLFDEQEVNIHFFF